VMMSMIKNALVTDYCFVDLEYGNGSNLNYDFKSIEEQLAKKILLRKRTFAEPLKFTQYQLELYLGDNPGLLDNFRNKVNQIPLPSDLQESIENQLFDMRQDELLNMRTSLETVLCFYKNDHIEENSGLFKLCQKLPATMTVDKGCMLYFDKWQLYGKHIKALYELIEDIAFEYVKDLISGDYKVQLTEGIEKEVEKYFNREDSISRENVAVAMRRFAMRYLIGDASEKNSLRDLISLKTELWPTEVADKVARFGQEFTEMVLVKHSWDILEKVGGLQEKKKKEAPVKLDVILGSNMSRSVLPKNTTDQILRNQKQKKW